MSFKIVSTTDVSIRNILQNASLEALGLYTAYCEVAIWQGSYIVKATTGFIAKRINKSKPFVIKYKKELIAVGMLEDIQRKDDEGKITGHYVQINHLANSIQPSVTEKPVKHNTAEPISNIVKDMFDDLRNKYRLKLKGKTRGLETEYDNFTKKHPKATEELMRQMNESMARMYTEKLREYPDGEFRYIPNFQTFINNSKWEEYL
jgi:predicted transcriptional regulator